MGSNTASTLPRVEGLASLLIKTTNKNGFYLIEYISSPISKKTNIYAGIFRLGQKIGVFTSIKNEEFTMEPIVLDLDKK